MITVRPLKDHGWSVNFNQKVVPDQDVISERILENLSFKAASSPTKNTYVTPQYPNRHMGIISSIIPCQDPMSKLHTSGVLENFLNIFIR